MIAEAIVLGSGTSNGVPTLGIDYPPEFLANPKNHRMRPSLLLKGPNGNVLIDCAPEMRLQLVRQDIKQVDAVIITHTHADHIMGMDDLRSFCLSSGRDMPVYTLPRYQEDIRRVFNYAFQDFPPGIHVPRFDLRDAPETLHYVDPPYMAATRDAGSDYRHEMTDDCHADLLSFLRTLRGHVVISGYPDDRYDAALAGWRRVEHEALADGATKRTEVLWMNFETQGLFQ